MKRLILFLFALVAVVYALTEAPKLTFDQAVAAYYRSVAVLNAHQLQWTQTIQADGKAVDAAAEVLRGACAGTLDGMDKFEPTCKSADKPKPAPVK